MTHDADRFAIIPVTHGPAPDDAIVVGPMREVMEYIPQSVARNDALEELEQARFTADQISAMQEKTRAVQATMLADSVNHLSSRLDAYPPLSPLFACTRVEVQIGAIAHEYLAPKSGARATSALMRPESKRPATKTSLDPTAKARQTAPRHTTPLEGSSDGRPLTLLGK